jgi:putative transposase
MVSPRHKKTVAKEVVEAGLCSGRAACRFLGLARGTWWYRSRPVTEREQRLLERLEALSQEHPRYGYRRIAALVRQEGWAVRVLPPGRRVYVEKRRPTLRISRACDTQVRV